MCWLLTTSVRKNRKPVPALPITQRSERMALHVAFGRSLVARPRGLPRHRSGGRLLMQRSPLLKLCPVGGVDPIPAVTAPEERRDIQARHCDDQHEDEENLHMLLLPWVCLTRPSFQERPPATVRLCELKANDTLTYAAKPVRTQETCSPHASHLLLGPRERCTLHSLPHAASQVK